MKTQCERCTNQAVVRYVREHPLLDGTIEQLCPVCAVAVYSDDYLATGGDRDTWEQQIAVCVEHQRRDGNCECQCNSCHLTHTAIADHIARHDRAIIV